MKHFKKRTLALVLASVVTVVGAFGAENYKNSLMSMKISSVSADFIGVTLLTKEQYNRDIAPVRLDEKTYVIMLPEVNSEISKLPDLGTNIESIDVKTMPYTTSSDGYTKIIIRVQNNASLSIKKEIYVATTSKEPEKISTTAERSSSEVSESAESGVNNGNSTQNFDKESAGRARQTNSIRSSSGVDQTGSVDINKTMQQFQPSTKASNVRSGYRSSGALTIDDINKEKKTATHQEIIYMILGIAFVIATSVFLMLKARDKLVEITGERSDYDVDDDNKASAKKKEKPQINTTISNLDRQYKRPMKMPVQSEVEVSEELEPEEPTNVPEVENVVDLDELLNEQNKQTEESSSEEPVNEALEDFLSSFSLDEETVENEPEEQGINEELYNKYINDNTLEFTKDDVEKIETLMKSEISDETLRNASEFLPSSEKEKKPSTLELLEKFVTTYTLERNITFTKEDIEALKKIINVEIDSDFLTDLRTNPSRMQEMQDEIAKQKAKPHKTSELLTLNVKDMLPDLSEALKKQGGRKIESEVKPQVVYYSEGYDVNTLKLNTDLPDLSKEINNEEAYKSRPSDEIQYADTSYDVQKMSISNELPDLEDMLKHPEKYETPEQEEVKVDEEALLRNITNVTFKPFDDGTRDFEVLNDVESTPSVSDMQAEFDQFGDNFEIINEEEVPEVKDTEKNDFETLYDGKYVDLDKDNNADKSESSSNSEDTTSNSIEGEEQDNPKEDTTNSIAEVGEDVPNISDTEEKESEAQKLLNMIKSYETKRQAKRAEKKQTSPAGKKVEENKIPIPDFCVFEDERYSIVSASKFNENMGCYLAKNDNGYAVLGFVGDRIFKIKSYETLKTEKLQTRIAEKLDDGTVRYIVRIGTHKFLLNVKSDDMEFVMDLC